MNKIIIEARNMTKNFLGIKVLDNINLTFYSGEVHALIGENGAGKSPLMLAL